MVVPREMGGVGRRLPGPPGHRDLDVSPVSGVLVFKYEVAVSRHHDDRNGQRQLAVCLSVLPRL